MTKAEQIKKESRERTEKWIEDNLMPVFEETLEIDGVPVMVSPLEQFRERVREKERLERLKESEDD